MAKFGYLSKISLFLSLLLILPWLSFAQQPSPETRLRTGVELYGQGKWREAVLELRRAQAEAPTTAMRGEALFWISLAGMAAGEYEQALRDITALEEIDPRNPRIREIPYHKGRIYYYLGRFDEAIIELSAYANSFRPGPSGVLSHADSLKKAAALYWTGECLFFMNQLDVASDIFSLIIRDYPLSPKFEASTYRIALINQKRVEAELLVLLRWTHEEALRNMEDFRRRETTYDQALGAFQKQIANLHERPEEGYKEQLELAEARIRFLENMLYQVTYEREAVVTQEADLRLHTLRDNAQELENLIQGNGK